MPATTGLLNAAPAVPAPDIISGPTCGPGLEWRGERTLTLPGKGGGAQNTPDISVCIANWNCRELLRCCLRSLEQQAQDLRLEVIVVDNASSDGAAEMVAEEFPGVFLATNPVNRGFAAASNQAARLGRGRYLFFLNNDTLVPAGALRRMLDYAQAHPAGLLGPCLVGSDGRVQVSCRPRPTVAALLHRTWMLRWTGLLRPRYRRYRRPHNLRPQAPMNVETLMGAALMVPRDIFFSAGGWDEDYAFGGEDFDLSWRIGRRYPLVYLPDVAIVHHGRASTRLHVEYTAPNVAIGFLRYLRKSGSARPALWLYKSFITLDAPVQLILKGLQCGWRWVTGRPRKARQSLQRVRELWYFLTRGVLDFWKV